MNAFPLIVASLVVLLAAWLGLQWLYVAIFVALLAVALAVYFGCNKGMARNARGQQSRRLTIASLLAVLPATMAQVSPLLPQLMLLLVVAAMWMITYPLLYHLSNRRSSPDYENYMDIDFGLYLYGGLSALMALLGVVLPGSAVVAAAVSVVEAALMALPLFQWVYFATYRTAIDATGMAVMLDTNRNEILEFFRSFSWWQVALAALAFIVPVAAIFAVNLSAPMGNALAGLAPIHRCVLLVLLLSLAVFLNVYTWKQRHGVFMRTGLVTLYNNVREHKRSFSLYKEKNAERYSRLHVEALGKPCDKPSTIILVIGESACRDYMSAFNPRLSHDTTPWLSEMSRDSCHFYLFPHAYSCAQQTVPALTRALTESNQYNHKVFYDSTSFIDIAHKLGYRVQWYSNQGHLGAAETPITIMADTAEVDKWTLQEVGKVQYDETLLDFFSEVDPNKNNLIVFHLKGSHFNYLNRYPASATKWGQPGVQDNILNYENSLCYTDSVLRRIYEYASGKLNLQAMVYCSDHADVPGMRRQPGFNGYGMTRIPLFVYLSDGYILRHPGRAEALDRNRSRYFTNDLLYELLCGVLDVKSPAFDETNCLASTAYKWQRDQLLTYEGRRRVADDDTEQ